MDLATRTRLLDLPAELHDRDHVIAFQHTEGLTADGDPGPITYGRWLDRQFAAVSPAERLLDPGRWVVNRLLREWTDGIIDPPRHTDSDPQWARHRERIDGYFKRGLGWTWDGIFRGGVLNNYTCDGDEKWCLAFRAFGDMQVGLRADVRLKYASSTQRLDALGRGVGFGKHKPIPGVVEQYVRLDEDSTYLTDVRPGDILLVGGCEDGDLDEGSHGTTVLSFDGTGFDTIEANARGRLVSGKREQGVVKARRPLGLRSTDKRSTYHARRLIRFAREAYEIPG